MTQIVQTIAAEINARAEQVTAAIALLDEGATVPFIARYRKEVTGGLDDSQLRLLEERLVYLRELGSRRDAILKSIKEQEKLTPELEKALLEATTKTQLEDLYLPYKPKRRTKAQIAREAGLEPLADAIAADPAQDPATLAAGYLNAEHSIDDAAKALDGAKQIWMERFTEQAELLQSLRSYVWKHGQIESSVLESKEQEGAKFRDYFEFDEALHKMPSHRALALLRGRNEGILTLKLALPDEESPNPCEQQVSAFFEFSNNGRPGDKWLAEAVRWGWRVKLSLKIELDLMNDLRQTAEEEAIRVFGANLKDLLLAAPAGPRATLGLDPGLRTGVKVAVVDHTGKLLDHATIYPHVPKKQWDQSLNVLATLCAKHNVELLAIGNGTASRETDQLAADLIKRHAELKLTKIMVSEAGASVYSASAMAAAEFPNLDVSIRGAVSIARRLQDPLAELVKIEPKSIGVGQYQHDVNQVKLNRALVGVVEDCVNSVGVDLNTASAALLSRVAGLNETIANNVIEYRDSNGAFKNRKQLLKVARLGDRTFEQAAGFLRIPNGDNPLDASSVHPEAYPLVEKISQQANTPLADLMGNSSLLKGVSARDLADEVFGLPTVRDILVELDKPGRDPRPEFKTAEFRDGVETIADLEEGMQLQGVVTNVANFGAFVDVGVHQDGLVHVSQLADKFVKDPREVVKAGDVVSVKVTEVDVARKRIGLTMRKHADSSSRGSVAAADKNTGSNRSHAARKTSKPAPAEGAMAAAFAAALRR